MGVRREGSRQNGTDSRRCGGPQTARRGLGDTVPAYHDWLNMTGVRWARGGGSLPHRTPARRQCPATSRGFEPAAHAQHGLGRARRAWHLLDVLGALVVDEDDDRVDVHVVQPLDGVGGDVQEAVPVLRGGGGGAPGRGRAGPQGPSLRLPRRGPTPHLTLPGLALPVNKSGATDEQGSLFILTRRGHVTPSGETTSREISPH